MPRHLTELAAAVLVALCGCASAPAPAKASPATLSLIAEAERHERGRRYDQARILYRRSTESAPDPRSRAHAARRFAAALAFWGEYANAAIELERVVSLDPKDPAAWHDLGVLRHQLGDTQGAATALRRSVSHAPTDARPRIALAAVLVNQRRFHAALAQYETILTLDIPPKTRTAVQKGISLLRQELRAP